MLKGNLKRGFKTWSEKQACLYREKLNLESHDNLLALALAKLFNVEIITPNTIKGLEKGVLKILLNNGATWSALTFKLEERFFIILNDSHSKARQKSNVLHELAHIICKHKLKGFEKLGAFMFRVYDSEQEGEAEWLGGCLHIPRKALEWAHSHSMNKDEICKYYCASLDMVNYRINVTGIKNQYQFF